LLCKKKIVPKQNLTVKVINIAFSIIIKLEDKKKIAKNITYARGINLVQTAILASCARFYFIKNPPVENHVQKNKLPMEHHVQYLIKNALKPQNKILIHHIQTKEYMH
jgi:hypothetical protein